LIGVPDYNEWRRLQVLVAQKVAAGVYRGVTTSELDELAAETAAAMTSMHPDYALVSNLLETALCCGARLTLTSIPAAGSKDRRVQPAQEHPQVLLNDVSWSERIKGFTINPHRHWQAAMLWLS
jgi:hypothetical protein